MEPMGTGEVSLRTAVHAALERPREACSEERAEVAWPLDAWVLSQHRPMGSCHSENVVYTRIRIGWIATCL